MAFHKTKAMKYLIYLCFLPTFLAGQVISSFPHTEDFESGAGGWTTGGTNNWVRGLVNKPTIKSSIGGSTAWTNNGLVTQYPASEQSWVQSPRYDFTSLQYPHVTFSAWWETEYQYDGVVLAYSTDGGGTWTQLGNDTDPVNCLNANWYNRNSTTYVDWPASNRDSWSGNTTNITGGGCVNGNGSGGWISVQHCLPASLGGQSDVRFRFHIGVGTLCHDDGFAFDNFTIQESPIAANFGIVSCVGNTVTFSDLSAPCATAWSWNFGDAGTSSLKNPSHSYATAGTYTVTLTATNPCGKTNAISQVVNVGACVLPTVLTSFTVNRFGNTARINWRTGEPVPGFEAIVYEGQNVSAMSPIQSIHIGNTDSRTEFILDLPIAEGTVGVAFYKLLLRDQAGQEIESPVRQLTLLPNGFISMYPNPAPQNGQLTVEMSSDERCELVELLTPNGQDVQLPFDQEGSKILLDLHIPSGLYFIRIVQNGQVFLKKIAVE